MAHHVDHPTALEPVSDTDHVQLSRLVDEISWRIDHQRAETVHELFLHEGTLALGPDQTLTGRDAIRHWGRGIDAADWQIRHVTTNARFLAQGQDSACGITLVTAYMQQPGNPASTVPWVIGEDHDRFVRTAEGWRFQSRRWQELFVSPDPRTT
jgi:SnoaL-like domain